MRVRNSKSDSKSEGNFSDLPGSVSRCSGGRTFKFCKFQASGVFVFHFHLLFLHQVSIAAALIIAVPCDLPLACSQPSPGPGSVPFVPQPEHHRSRAT